MRRKKTVEDYNVSWECRLRVFRAEKSLTQEEVASSLGVTRQTISAIEKGSYNPSLGLAYRIAKLFNVTIEEMFNFKNSD